MTRFDWRTEDENEALSASAPGLRRLTRRPGKIAMLVVGLAVLVLLVGAWQLRRQADERTRQVEADILAGFDLWRTAVENVDLDLFDTLLVGAEPGWHEFQRRILVRGLALNRPLLGLRLAGEEQAIAANSQVTLSPDWRTAEIAFNTTYQVAAGRAESVPVAPGVANLASSPTTDSQPVPIILEQRLTFSQQGQHWVLTEAPDEFWGELQTIETTHLTLTFYETDAAFAARFANDLEQELVDLAAENCSRLGLGAGSGRCGSVPAVNLRLAVEPELWLDSTTLPTLPLIRGREQLLPSPSVVGRPVDEASYQFLYRVLTANLVSSLRTRLVVPVALPEQSIAVACFPESRSGQRLFLYDPSQFTWQMIQTDYAFRQFSPLPDDSGLVIEQHVSANESTGLRLRLWNRQSDRLLYDEPDFARLMTAPFGWSTPAGAPHLLLHGFEVVPQASRFHLLDPERCTDNGCFGHNLPGYPIWSPNNQQVILIVNDELFLGSGSGLELTPAEIASQWISLGPGFSPFWLDDARFGFARYIEQDGLLAVEIMLATAADPRPWQLLSPEDLTTAAGYQWPAQPVFINHLYAHPNRPDTVFVGSVLYSGAGDNRDDGRQFRLFSVTAPPGAGRPGESIKRLLTLDGVPAGYPSMLNASGAVPFSFSPDGRWILATQAKGPVPGGWLLYLYNIDDGRLITHLTGHPPENFRYLFFDWSADGEWLVVVDDGFMRLIAPAHDYEQKVPLEQPVCGQVAWLDWS